MQKTKVIYFDLGKVLVDFDWSKAVERMAQYSILDRDSLYETLTSSPLAMAYELGKTDSENFFKSLKKDISFSESAEYLRQSWNDIFTPVRDHIQIAEALSLRYPLGLISNTNPAHAEHIDSEFHLFKLFSARIFSFEVRLVKPQQAMFEFAAARFNADASEILLIDDLEENVRGARAMGWQAIHCNKGQNLLDALKELNV